MSVSISERYIYYLQDLAALVLRDQIEIPRTVIFSQHSSGLFFIVSSFRADKEQMRIFELLPLQTSERRRISLMVDTFLMTDVQVYFANFRKMHLLFG